MTASQNLIKPEKEKIGKGHIKGVEFTKTTEGGMKDAT